MTVTAEKIRVDRRISDRWRRIVIGHFSIIGSPSETKRFEEKISPSDVRPLCLASIRRSIVGREEDVEKAALALEKMVPVEDTVEIAAEAHGSLVGKGGSQLQTLIKQYPDVQITFPPLKSNSDVIRLKGQSEQVEGLKKELLERYEKFQSEKEARSYELHFTIKPEYRSLIIGNRRRTLNTLKQKHDVNILIANSVGPSSAVVPTPSASTEQDEQPAAVQPDDQQATPQEPSALSAEALPVTDVEVSIIGHESSTLACRDEIFKLIEEFESKITMEIEIDHRIHARIIGSGGSKLQQLMKDHGVEIQFPSNNRSDKVHVIGVKQENIDACIDHLLILEDDYLQDMPASKQQQQSQSQASAESSAGQYPQQEVPSSNKMSLMKAAKVTKQQKQAPFKVKNAPWTAEDEQQSMNPAEQRNGYHHKSPKKPTAAPHPHDLGEYPTISNGLAAAEAGDTRENKIPIIWGPSKRNKQEQ